MSRLAGPRRAFSLIELLVVIAIIAVLMALLMGAVQTAREAANRTVCRNNLHQIGIALHVHHDASNAFPPGSVTTPTGIDQYYGVWSVFLLPYLENETLYGEYDPSQLNWASGPGQAAVRTALVREYTCPSDPMGGQVLAPESGNGAGVPYRTGSYRAMVGRGQAGNDYLDYNPNASSVPRPYRGVMHTTGFDGLTAERIEDVTDGTSNTIMAVERVSRTHPARHTFWAYSHASYWSASPNGEDRILLDYDACVAVNPGDPGPCKRGMGSTHASGFHAVYADGSTHLLNRSISASALESLATMAGGD